MLDPSDPSNSDLITWIIFQNLNNNREYKRS